MTQFRKKHDVVEAVQFLPGNIFTMATMQQHLAGGTGWTLIDETLTIRTHQGSVVAESGDYIIKDSDGGFYRSTAELFEAIYEKE